MTSVCFICLNEDAPQCRVTRNSKKDNWLECDGCKQWFHAECGGYTALDCKKFSSRNWLKCVVCCLRNIHTSSSQGNTDLSSLVTEAVQNRVTVSSRRVSASSNTVSKSLSALQHSASKTCILSSSVSAAKQKCHTNDSCVTDKESEKSEENPVLVSDTNANENILIIDNISNPADFSSSKRILHEVNLYCPEVKIEYAYSLAKGGVAIHTVDKSARDFLLNKLPQESFGGGTKHLPRDRSCVTVFIKGVCTSVSTQDFTQVLKRCHIETIDVRRLVNRHSGKPLRVLKVKCSEENSKRLLLCQIVINNTTCVIEKERSVRVIRCYNCQSFGHLAKFCSNKRRCEFCSGSHLHEHCSDEIRCANCGGNHSASSLLCPVYISQYEVLAK